MVPGFLIGTVMASRTVYDRINLVWQYVDDCFMNRITTGLYWQLREHPIDRLDENAKTIKIALERLLRVS